MKELKISAIKEGTVIDHIPAKNVFKVVEILKLNDVDDIISIATGLKSKRLKTKGMIKVGGKFLNKVEVNKIALIAPSATLNIIKDYEVTKKTKVKVPETIEGLVRCSNPNCITNHEPARSKFHTIKTEPLELRCHFCERSFHEDEIVLI
ncbi:MAG: aspartate carbamoyltransferase regulatory subunit [archaeon]